MRIRARVILGRFFGNCEGSIAVQFAVAALPILGLVGASVDYMRASRIKSDLQASLDSAVLAAVKNGDQHDWRDIATNVFASGAPKEFATAVPNFTKQNDGSVVGTVSVTVPTELIKVAGIQSIDVAADAVASAHQLADSCILALDEGSSTSNNGILFNGAPNIQLNECTLRSNTSLRCNGHDGGAIASIAVGSASNCDNPESNAEPVPDNFASLADNITHVCGGIDSGATWMVPGAVPVGAITVAMGDYVEYHICGDLTVTGNGYLTGSAPAADSVIVIENGKLIVDDKSTISTMRTTIVLTGDNSRPSRIEFPNGKGKASTLSLSPSISAGNPWQGISLYQDPSLTNGVDNDWGPSTTFNPDGVVYLPKSDVELRGNSASGLSGCTKMVVKSLRTNGAVNLQYGRDAAGCDALGVDQWSDEGVGPVLTL